MRWLGYKAYYYESLPIDTLDAFDVPERDGVKTGGMSAKMFLKLVSSIEKKGLTNPIIVEHGRRLKVAMGNNRVWAMKHLGHTHIPVVLFAREVSRPDGGELIPTKFLESRMKKIHPGDNTWIHSQAARMIRKSCRQEVE
jgi:hypothetical protein